MTRKKKPPETAVEHDLMDRAAIVDGEMGWPSCLAFGRLMTIRIKSRGDSGRGAERASAAMIAVWAGIDRAERENFLALCCRQDVRFLEHRDNDQYEILGNDVIFQARADRSAAGAASAQARKDSEGTAVPRGASNRRTPSEHPPNTCSAVVRTNAEQASEHPPNRPPNNVRTECRTSAEQTAEQVFGSEGSLATALPDQRAIDYNSNAAEVVVVVEENENFSLNSKTTTTTSVEDAGARATADDLAALWNEVLAGRLPRTPKRMNRDTLRVAEAALAENADLEFWRRVFITLGATPFLVGKKSTFKSPDGFRPALKWALLEHERILNGEFGPTIVERAPQCARCCDTGEAGMTRDCEVASVGCECPAGERYRGQRWNGDFLAAGWVLDQPSCH